jgi:hypothetical protein
MKYIRKFNEEVEKSIEDLCLEFDIQKYEIVNGLVNVNDHVDISNKSLTKIPIPFNIVTRLFNCGHNKLISLKGCPKEVGYRFDCCDNKLTSLEYGPKVVGTYFCEKNKLRSLEYAPKEGVILCCYSNPIHNVYVLFDNIYEKYTESLDFDYFRNNYTCIVKGRFEKALIEIKKIAPDSIPEYEYI